MATAEEADVAMANSVATATADISDRTEIVAAHVAGDKPVAEVAHAVGNSVADIVHPAEFDKEQFVTVIPLQALAVPARLAQQTSRIVHGHTFDRPRLRHILPHPSDASLRLVLLDDVIKDASRGGCNKQNLPAAVRQQLQQEGLWNVTTYEQRLDYSYWPAGMPSFSVDTPPTTPSHSLPPACRPHTEEAAAARGGSAHGIRDCRYYTLSHIAHVNLRDDLLPYRFVIGKVLLEPRPSRTLVPPLLQKNTPLIRAVVNKSGIIENEFRVPTLDLIAGEGSSSHLETSKNAPLIKTVVNKSGIIENEFRVPTLELIAGEGSSSHLETSVRQHGATFHVDYACVYWNSRLEHEHKRLVDAFFRRGDVVVDMFAGVGPFAVPAAKAGCAVLANDLNPASVEYLRRNVRVNGVEGRVRAYNEDARVFVRGVLKPPEGGEVAIGVEGTLEEERKKAGDGEAGGKEHVQQEEGGNGEREQQSSSKGGEQRVAVGSASGVQEEAEAVRGGATGSTHGQVAREAGETDLEDREAAGGHRSSETAGSRDGREGGEGRGAGGGVQGENTKEEKAEEVNEGEKQEGLGEGKGEQNGGRSGRKGKGKRKGGKGGKGGKCESKDEGGIEVALVAPWRHVDHVVMNLPASAITFLGALLHSFPATPSAAPSRARTGRAPCRSSTPTASTALATPLRPSRRWGGEGEGGSGAGVSFMTRAALHDKSCPAWHELPCMARAALHGTSCPAWHELPYMARAALHGKSCPAWHELPCMAAACGMTEEDCWWGYRWVGCKVMDFTVSCPMSLAPALHACPPCMPSMHALHACPPCMPSMHALHACPPCMPSMHARPTQPPCLPSLLACTACELTQSNSSPYLHTACTACLHGRAGGGAARHLGAMDGR
ncbi:unnamed protein product [Closterium sp. Naga37s-1]|nr:unnamed protein product [Closterium sp. Naga37s-1]